MADRVLMPDGRLTIRDYDTLIVPAWLLAHDEDRPIDKLPTIKVFVDSESAVMTTNPHAFEAWIRDHRLGEWHDDE